MQQEPQYMRGAPERYFNKPGLRRQRVARRRQPFKPNIERASAISSIVRWWRRLFVFEGGRA